MIKLRIIRPNTLGVTFEREYECYTDAEEFIERRVERWADQGWEPSELSGSNSKAGTIELTHDDVADTILIQWGEE